VADGDVFHFNAQFTAALTRVKINQIQLKETKAEVDATNERVFQDRLYQIDAAIVRTMKARKTMGHQTLLAELFAQLRFPAKVSGGLLGAAQARRRGAAKARGRGAAQARRPAWRRPGASAWRRPGASAWRALLSPSCSRHPAPPQAADIAKRIDSLIERDYLERDEEEAQTYHYVA
jgi:hypothetical protein